ncbi:MULTISPECIES: phosphoenolpyruvate synthase [unclassified Halorhodospira]|uniref:phosphoenolpyruvate synthase n=1 Tax=unclassified Halorhodospira TaxID=2626748 RepID=UPI001EE7A372|nr:MULTISPECIES: phosphoenolpyruvate synthase [unclassified Halorhodospira]MCG5540344.1 phosphoenolpyruvate synthase [Halorhodospira sp. M39old]MCG5545882.1 phosphoenolpyruvate synthase [Halorhodospira sp. M38]
MQDYVVEFDALGMGDVDQVGGKNASLGEMISNLAKAGVRVPGGFATTAKAYWEFLDANNLRSGIRNALAGLDVDDVEQLAATGAKIRQMILDAPLPESLDAAIRAGYEKLESQHPGEASFAVRSSATAEDLPDASFAGQQETFLNVRGLDGIREAIHHVFASLFTDRAIAYRVHHGFDHEQVALSAGIQRMVRSDIGASGVMFTMDTESGFREAVFVTASWGLGETVVQGAVNPDEFYVYKPNLEQNRPAILRRNLGGKAIKMVYSGSTEHGKTVETVDVPESDRMRFCLNDADIEDLARQAVIIEKHYGRPMDIEWGKDGEDGQLYILQARPETVKSRDGGQVLERYHLKDRGQVLTEGRAIGQRIGAGPTRVVQDVSEINRVQEGDVLVTDMTDPDWEPIMKRAAAIVTNRGGRTCHAAIIARELGIPAIVGCGNATETIPDSIDATVSCAEGDTGYVYEGKQDFEVREVSLSDMPDLPFKIMMNVGNPDRAFDFQFLPNEGVGLARVEFIINRMIGIHPRALLEFDQQEESIKRVIRSQTAGYENPEEFYVDKLAEGVSMLGAAFHPKPVIVRMSDFKSNEYANLIGGEKYEPHEENPMIGFRGASRYISPDFQECFKLECRALRRVRDEMGLDNVWLMVPFVRTTAEAEQVIRLLAENGLERGKDGLKVMMMCELPSNAVLADEFLEHFDGFSIGSNDLTQLTLGLDRDSGVIADQFDERNEAVKRMLSMAIQACRRHGKYVGICGQGPSDYPDLARWLMDEGIESVSLNPDTVVETWLYLAGKEQ